MACIVYGKGPAILFTLPETKQWLWLGASGIIGLTIGDFFLFSAFQMMGPRYASLFSTLAPAAALITGIFLLGEGISLDRRCWYFYYPQRYYVDYPVA